MKTLRLTNTTQQEEVSEIDNDDIEDDDIPGDDGELDIDIEPGINNEPGLSW